MVLSEGDESVPARSTTRISTGVEIVNARDVVCRASTTPIRHAAPPVVGSQPSGVAPTISIHTSSAGLGPALVIITLTEPPCCTAVTRKSVVCRLCSSSSAALRGNPADVVVVEEEVVSGRGSPPLHPANIDVDVSNSATAVSVRLKSFVPFSVYDPHGVTSQESERISAHGE
jgi:hypothetical protein